MSNSIGTYTFLPWVRRGLANRIGVVAAMRPSIQVTLDIEGTKGSSITPATVERAVELYGPGDVIGVDAAQISRTEPPNWITNFEPNYLVAIEFYDEDFPWRYTPAAPVGRRLLPWLALIVLEEQTEFEEGRGVAGRPLPYITVTADFTDVFADPSEAWAWAHAHFNAEFSSAVVEIDQAKAAEGAQRVIDTAPDTACSRLLCPRKLKPTTGYHAFLVPAFESGRLAGLGRDPKPLFDDAANGLHAISSSWGAYAVPANRPEPSSVPFYYRWYFRTAENGDFESLVRLLKPRIVDSRVGQRDMDVSDPAPNLAGIEKLNGVLRLGGALKAPFDTLPAPEKAEFTKFDQWADPFPEPFQQQLAAFVNLADEYQQQGPAANSNAALDGSIQSDPDPLITPPIYGRWHALIERLLTAPDGSDVPDRTNWMHDLNLDPRWRVAAGFGTTVIQAKQEEYMSAAWEQIGDVLEANRRIRQAQLAKVAGRHLHERHVQGAASVSAGTLLLKTAPLKSRVVSEGLTVHHRVGQSPLGVAFTSSAMRRAIRPGGRVAMRLALTDARTGGEIVARANDGAISAAPPKQPPRDLLTADDLAAAAAPSQSDATWVRLGQWLQQHRTLAIVLLVALLLLVMTVLGMTAVGFAATAVLAVAAIAVSHRAMRAADRQTASDRLREDALTPATVDAMPGSSHFTLTTDADPRNGLPPLGVPRGEADNAAAVEFKTALRDEYRLLEISRAVGTPPVAVPLHLDRVATDIVAGIRPDVTVPRWTLSGIRIPTRIREQTGQELVEVMAYPEFDTPMYEPLARNDKDGFVPNLHLVESDSVTLLETNQRFIEAYMVGVNHEFARELLWREYPTDQRGSYFRQFWDVRKKVAEAADKAAARERLKDIKPLHRWPITSDLGDNDNREVGPDPEEELVLVIRGELLKKYPNTVISAQRAKWQLTGGLPDKSKERQLDDSTPPIFPLYEARVEPDIYFFGFDLKAEDARGDDTVNDKPGWFFRIEEVPGDARFGFDISRDPQSAINVWNDLGWADVNPGIANGMPVKVASIPPRALVEPTGNLIEKHQQWEVDRFVPLDSELSAAEFAYIALQTPVIMAVHASELLPNQEPANV